MTVREQSHRVPLVVDTDTAGDDCFALLTIDLAGRAGEVTVFTGARRPLDRERFFEYVVRVLGTVR